MTDSQSTGIENAMRSIANSIMPYDVQLAHDETGGTVACLTEAVMGMTAAMCKIACALDNIADAIKESKSGDC